MAGAAGASSIAHRLSTIRGADRLVVLDGSRIVESGSHNQLLAYYRMTYEPAAPDGDGRRRDAQREALRPPRPRPVKLGSGGRFSTASPDMGVRLLIFSAYARSSRLEKEMFS